MFLYHCRSLCAFDFCDKLKVSFPLSDKTLFDLSLALSLISYLTCTFCFFFFGREKELWHNKILSPFTQQHQSHRNYLQDNDVSKAEALYNYDVSFLKITTKLSKFVILANKKEKII